MTDRTESQRLADAGLAKQSLVLPKTLWQRAKVDAARKGVTLRQWFEDVIEDNAPRLEE